jgi:DNA-binding response OmpR family regulator
MATVLIIDDDRTAADAMAALLRREGYGVLVAGGAVDALHHLRHEALDLVLVDMAMPDFNGLEVLQALSEEPRYEGLPMAVLSGSAEPELRAAAARLGARDYLLKGTPWGELSRRIRELVDGSAVAVIPPLPEPTVQSLPA